MENDVIALTKKLISIPSTNSNPVAIQHILEIIKGELKAYTCTEFVSNGIGSLLFSNTEEQQRHFKILLNVHIDVVPGEKIQFEPYEEDGKLYGRGALDMKSAAATMITLFKKHAKEVGYPLGLQIVADEEMGGENGTKHQIDQKVRADFVLGGDTPGLKINNEAKGVYHIKLQANGIAAHAAYPWNGKNASFLMMQTIHKLHELLPLPEKEVWESTASIIKIETDNDTVNTIPHSCIAYINIRFIPEEKRHLLAEIQDLLPEGVTMEVLFNVPPEYTSTQDPFVEKLRQSIETVTAKPAEFLKSHAQSDLRYYHMLHIPAVNLGPTGGNHHAKEEWVDLESLELYQKILKEFLLSM